MIKRAVFNAIFFSFLFLFHLVFAFLLSCCLDFFCASLLPRSGAPWGALVGLATWSLVFGCPPGVWVPGPLLPGPLLPWSPGPLCLCWLGSSFGLAWLGFGLAWLASARCCCGLAWLGSARFGWLAERKSLRSSGPLASGSRASSVRRLSNLLPQQEKRQESTQKEKGRTHPEESKAEEE